MQNLVVLVYTSMIRLNADCASIVMESASSRMTICRSGLMMPIHVGNARDFFLSEFFNFVSDYLDAPFVGSIELEYARSIVANSGS